MTNEPNGLRPPQAIRSEALPMAKTQEQRAGEGQQPPQQLAGKGQSRKG